MYYASDAAHTFEDVNRDLEIPNVSEEKIDSNCARAGGDILKSSGEAKFANVNGFLSF